MISLLLVANAIYMTIVRVFIRVVGSNDNLIRILVGDVIELDCFLALTQTDTLLIIKYETPHVHTIK